jgi:hypothetical protein
MMIHRYALLFLALGIVPAMAQQQLGSYVDGLPAATLPLAGAESIFLRQGGLSKRTPVSSIALSSAGLDAAFGSTRGSILERGTSTWGAVSPGTSGLPWVSNGAGADPAYQALTGSGIAGGTITGANIASATITGGNVASATITGANVAAATVAPSNLTTLPAFDSLCNATSSTASPTQCQAGILHSKDMGAVGNGVTDDTTALQNWINACQTNGLICFLDQGTYKITAALSVTSAIHIAGVGYQQASSIASIIQPATTISGINAVTTQPVIIHDIGVNYASAANSSTSAIILTASGAANINTGSRIDRVNIQNAFNGFNIGQAQYWTVSNCLIQAIPTNGTGFTLDNSALSNPDQGDSTITGCAITLPAAASTGVAITSFAGLRVNNNKIIAAGAGGTGITLNLKSGVTSSLLKVIGNSIEGMSNGIILQRAGTTGSFTNVVIANNEFEPGTGSAAVNNPTDANGVWLNNVMISGNIIFGPTTSTSSFGYIVKAASGVQISSNLTISNSSTNGFQALATTGSNNCTLGPNGHGAGLFVASDTGCTTVATIAPN